MSHIPMIAKKTAIKWTCPVCALMKVPCLLPSMEMVLPNLDPGQLLYIDFAFMSEVSI